MTSQVICGCGLAYQRRAQKADRTPRCPVCGRELKVSSSPGRNPGQEPRTLAWLKVGIGVVSALGLLALAIFILSPDLPGKKPPPRGAVMPAAVAPASTSPSPSPALPTPSRTISDAERQMIPTESFGGSY